MSNMGIFIRTAVVLIMAWGIVFISEVIIQLKKLQKRIGFFYFLLELQQVYHGSVIIKRCNWGGWYCAFQSMRFSCFIVTIVSLVILF